MHARGFSDTGVLRRSRAARRAALKFLSLASVLVGLISASTAQAAPQVEKLVVPTTNVNAKDGRFMTVGGTTGIEVAVVLPDGYDPTRKYSTIMVLHGNDGLPDGFLNAEYIDVRAPDIQANRSIIVLPSIGQHATAVDWYNESGGAAKWEQFIVKDVLPALSKRYSISNKRQDRAIAGLSYGGYTAAYYGAKYPQIFGSVGVLSGVPTIFGGEMDRFMSAGFADSGAFNRVFGPVDGPRAKGHDPLTLVDNLRYSRVFVGRGNGVPDIRLGFNFSGWLTGTGAENLITPANDRFVAKARDAGVDTTYKIFQGVHAWPYFQDLYQDWLRWGPIARNVNPDPTYWNYGTSAQSGTAWQVDYKFDAPLNEVVTLQRRGDAITVTGGGKFTLTDRATSCTWTAVAPATGPVAGTTCPSPKRPVPDFESDNSNSVVVPSTASSSIRLNTKYVTVGRRTRLKFSVKAAKGNATLSPAKRAKVRVQGYGLLTTNSSGNAAVTVKPKKRGVIKIRVSIPNYPRVVVHVRAVKGMTKSKPFTARATTNARSGATPGG